MILSSLCFDSVDPSCFKSAEVAVVEVVGAVVMMMVREREGEKKRERRKGEKDGENKVNKMLKL